MASLLREQQHIIATPGDPVVKSKAAIFIMYMFAKQPWLIISIFISVTANLGLFGPPFAAALSLSIFILVAPAYALLENRRAELYLLDINATGEIDRPDNPSSPRSGLYRPPTYSELLRTTPAPHVRAYLVLAAFALAFVWVIPSVFLHPLVLLALVVTLSHFVRTGRAFLQAFHFSRTIS